MRAGLKQIEICKEDFDRYCSGHDDIDMNLGATTRNDQVFCQWIGESLYRQQGRIVEHGTWMGSLTISLAKGLERNMSISAGEALIDAYDIFRWDQHMMGWAADEEWARGLKPGDDYSKHYEGKIAPYRELVNVVKADLSSCEWSRQPIEWLVNDAWKSIDIIANVRNVFMPYLLPNRSHIAHQDFMWPRRSWLRLVMYFMADSIQPVFSVPDSPMGVYAVTSKLEPDAEMGMQLQAVDERDILDAAVWTKTIVPSERIRQFDLGTVWLLAYYGHDRTAKELLYDVLRDHSCNSGTLAFYLLHFCRSQYIQQAVGDFQQFQQELNKQTLPALAEKGEVYIPLGVDNILYSNQESYPEFNCVLTGEKFVCKESSPGLSPVFSRQQSL